MYKFKLFLILVVTVTLNYAQNKQIRAYNLEDGLPQSQVYDITQDNLGYIWLGTQGGGIARFDGNEFKVFNEKNGLLSNYIHSLKVYNTKLLIGTDSGLSIKNKNTFTNYKSPQINNILIVENQIYLATKKGCYLFNSGNKLSKLNLNRLLNNNIINDIKFKGDWFYMATNVGLWAINKDFSKKIKLSKGDFKSITIYKNTVFCASFTDGILMFKNNNFNFTKINSTERINNITILNDTELWIATSNSGITILNATTFKVLQKIDKKHGLPITHIRKAIKDKQANIWLASSSGIFKIYENNFSHLDEKSGLKGKAIYAINAFNDKIIFSNSEEGLVKIDSLGMQPMLQGKEYLNVKVRTLANDNHGNLYAGTDGNGVLLMHNSKKDSIFSYLKPDNSIAIDTITINYQFTDTLNINPNFKWIRKIHSKDNLIWVASYANGISKFNYNTSEREIENRINFDYKNGIKDLDITDITTDNKGALWYATKNGNLGFITNNKVTHLENVLEIKTAIRTLLFHKEQLFIATSSKGVWWSNLSKPLKFNKLVGKKELYSNNIYQLIFDANNQLWVGSESGVDKIILDENNNIKDLHHFGRNDGFLGIETCTNSVIKDSKDNLWFGTLNGLTKYQPTNTKFHQKKPKLFFETIEIMNVSLDSVLPQQFSKNKRILHLKSTQNLLSFYYKTIDLNNPKELQYRWKIDNLKWSTWNNDTKVNIASDYGNHIFYAQSRNLNWLESNVISFQFNRKKPLLKELWFVTLLSSIIGLLFLLFILNYFRKLKLQNKKEKAHLQLQNELLTLEQKALRLQMNPHFIFNVLNGIKAMSLNDTKKMNSTINKFATLLRATLTNSRKDNITLSQEITTLKNYIEVEQLMTEKKFTYNLTVKTELDIEEILIPPMLIQPFVENAIRHGIMAVKREGKISLNFKTENDFLHCTITDNGIGINYSKDNKPKSDHQSMALQVTKERIEHLAKNNTLRITEIHKNDKIIGTKVVFTIPLITDY